MRLIDADALERHVYTKWQNGELSNSEWVDFRQWLKDEPTVEPASPWHRVEDELPKVGKVVIAYGKRSASTGRFQGIGKNPWNWWWRGNTIRYVTHWMPLPEPPKEVQE